LLSSLNDCAQSKNAGKMIKRQKNWHCLFEGLTMFKIKWRTRVDDFRRRGQICPVITGLSLYATASAAEKQIAHWSYIFRDNDYYIVAE